MIGRTISHYKILAKLGAGGMGVVYKAEDTRLDRLVALKFLPHDIAVNAEERRHFKTEAKAAAALNHPNIATIYAIEEVNDEMFIVMEYIGGQELRQIIRAEIPDLPAATDYAAQIAEGLNAAHARGVVHRDIKSSNIMVTESGQVKIMDFGLAKIADSIVSTKTGAVKGTAAYMSPEQARGERVDSRTDIWSFGVVLYEMLTGRLPFRGDKEPAMLLSILLDQPTPVTNWRHDTPAALAQIVEQALVKNPAERFQRMEEILGALRDFKQTAANGRPAKIQRQRSVTKKRRFRRSLIAALAIVLLLAAGLGVFLSRPRGFDSLAVLPFVNVAADPSTEYLSDGFSESLIQNLSQLRRLKVISFSSVARFKGAAIELPDIGRELRVRAVLVGRLAQNGENLSISAELVDAKNNRHLWGEQYQRKVADLLLVQDDIVADVAYSLQPRLARDEQKRLARRHTPNVEAYQLYLKGRHYTAKITKEGFEKGLACFQQAVDKDPNYALAYDGLAYYYISANQWALSPRQAMPNARAAALKALEIDESLAEAHAALAQVYFLYDWDWPAAEREFQRALLLNPNYAWAHMNYATFLVGNGRLDEALVAAKRAYAIEPLSLEANAILGWILSLNGQNDQAIAQLSSALELDPSFWFARIMLAGAYEGKGRLEEAIAEYEQARLQEGEFCEALANLGNLYARHGMIEDARKILQELKSRAATGYVPPYFFFMLYYPLGEKDEALRWFEAAFAERDLYLIWEKVFAYENYKRSDPLLAAILDRVGAKE